MKHNALKNPIYRFIAVVLLLFQSAQSSGAELPQQETVPGGIAIIKLKETGAKAPKVSYTNKPVMVIQHDGAWYALVGIPLEAKPGEHIVSSSSDGDKNSYKFTVSDKAYETQYITIKDKRKVTPNEEDMKRIGKEKKKISAALAHWDDTFYASAPLLDLPARGRARLRASARKRKRP